MKQTNPFRSILSVAWKDLQVIFKDRGFLVVVIFLPAAFSVFFGTVNQKAMDNSRKPVTLPIALVNQDEGPYGEQIARILGDIDNFKLTQLDTLESAEAEVRSSKVMAAILIPPGLSQSVDTYQPSEIEVLIDPTQEFMRRLSLALSKMSSRRSRWWASYPTASAPCWQITLPTSRQMKPPGAALKPNRWRSTWHRCKNSRLSPG